MGQNKLRSKMEEKHIKKQIDLMKKFHNMNRSFQDDLKTAIQQSLKTMKEKEMPTEIKSHVQHIKKSIEKDMKSKKWEKLEGQMIKMEIQEILEKGIEIDYQDQKKYFSINVTDHEFDDQQEQQFKELLNTTYEEFGTDVYGFYHFKNDQDPMQILNLFWQNTVDSDSPYNTPFFGRKWNYTTKNIIKDQRIADYIERRTKTCKCSCTDGCSNPKTCPCYKDNNKLIKPTYSKIGHEFQNE